MAIVRRATLLCGLAGCAVMSWLAATLDEFLVLSSVTSLAAGLSVREIRDGVDGDSSDLRLAAVSIVCLLCGAVFLLALTGTTSLVGIRETLAANYQPQRMDLLAGRASILGAAAAIFILGGAALAIGLFPFQFPQTGLFNTTRGWQALAIVSLLRLQGLGLLVRVLDVASVGSEDAVQIVTGISGAATCLAGATLLCRVESLRAIAGCLWLTFGGLSVAAYSVCVTSPTFLPAQSVAPFPAGATAALAVTLLGIVICASLLALDARLSRNGRPLGHFDELTGLWRQAPGTAGLLATTLLSCLPFPPLPLFWSLLMIAGSAFVPGIKPDGTQQEFAGAVPLLTLAATSLALLLIAARLVYPLSLMFHHEPLRRFEPAAGRSSLIMATACVALLILTGLLPNLLFFKVASFVAVTRQ